MELTEWLERVPFDYRYTRDDLDKLELMRESFKEQLKKKEEETQGIEGFDITMTEEYRNLRVRCTSEEQQYVEAKEAYEKHRQERNKLQEERITRFRNGLQAVSARLQEIYKEMTRGGTAELEAVRQLDPFSEGLVLNVRPPGKSWKKMSNLSGGEKTLVSLSLVFALHQYKPSPLYFMDEIDAALDYKNVAMLSQFIKEKSLKC